MKAAKVIKNDTLPNIVRPFYRIKRMYYPQEEILSMRQDEISFTGSTIKTAAAIVRIFETGKALGDYSAVAVLNDGAGISYGISQFTHRSGSLLAVIRCYLGNGGVVGAEVFEQNIRLLESDSRRAIGALAMNAQFKSALRAAGMTAEMRAAQDAIAFERYMLPAIRACEGSGFVLPLSLAVVYDSMTHGSYEKIRDRVRISPESGKPHVFEKAWITEYVRKREAWLASIARLDKTRYRTQFFLQQIMIGRWELELPLPVRGVLLTNELLDISAADAAKPCRTVEPAASPITITDLHAKPARILPEIPATQPPAQPTANDAGEWLDRLEQRLNEVIADFDRIERMSRAVIDRTDRAKSLWTTVAAAAWQPAWALIGFLSGLPREVWFVVAGITAATMLFYLYRQIALGKIREHAETQKI